MTLELNKIYCMDCLEGMKQIEDKSIDLIVTDPPYGISYQSAWRIESKRFDRLVNDDKVDGRFMPDCYRVLKEDTAMYMFTRWDIYQKWVTLAQNAGFKEKNVLVWDRVIHGMGDLDSSYAPRYDISLYLVKGSPQIRGKRLADILRFQRINPEKLLHPTQKPIRLVQTLIEKSSDKGDVVFDPFIGSGTTALASKQSKRNYLGFEICREYFDIANKRLAQETLNDLAVFEEEPQK